MDTLDDRVLDDGREGNDDGRVPGDGDGRVPGDGDGRVPGDGDGRVPGDGDGRVPGDGDLVPVDVNGRDGDWRAESAGEEEPRFMPCARAELGECAERDSFSPSGEAGPEPCCALAEPVSGLVEPAGDHAAPAARDAASARPSSPRWSFAARALWALGWLLAACFFWWAFWEVLNPVARLVIGALKGAGAEGGTLVVWSTLISHGFAMVLAGLCWWLLYRRSHIYAERATVSRRAVARGALAGLLLGFLLQIFVSWFIVKLVQVAPELIETYRKHMSYPIREASAMGALVFSAILAPLTEEFVYRGVVMEFALSAVSLPRCRPKVASDGSEVSPMEGERDEGAVSAAMPTALFWVANIVQAFLFGVSHGNIVQGLYAMSSGLVAGWMTWEFKSLLPALALHISFNASNSVYNWLLSTSVAAGNGLYVFIPTLLCLIGAFVLLAPPQNPQ